jgi:hypothetical protein
MSEAETRARPAPAPKLDPERVAYWYLRLNGFLQIDNFVVHPATYGGQRADADLIGVRFPHRAERLFDNRDDLMADDAATLGLCTDKIDVVVAEVKISRCALNGPWTNEAAQNIHRVLAAVGCLPPEAIEPAAQALYSDAIYDALPHLRVRLVLIGREPDPDIAARYAGITQVTWAVALAFIQDRFQRYRRQKAQTNQWDVTGQRLKTLAQDCSPEEFFDEVTARMRRGHAGALVSPDAQPAAQP